MQAYAGPERRRFPRTECTLRANYSPLGLSGNCDYSRTVNISIGGMLLRTSDTFKKTSHLELIIRIPYNPPMVTLKGEVVWVKRLPNSLMNEIGIKFIQQNATLKQFIEEKFQ